MTKSGMNSRRHHVFTLIGAVMTMCTGCALLRDSAVSSAVRTITEPETARDYLLYQPSYYDRDKQWPLVVICPTSGMFSSASGQMRSWTRAAEASGFLIARPALESLSAGWRSDSEERGDKLRRNERHVLAVVRHIKAAYHISEDRVFICGQSQGAHDALYIGMGNPQVFRAVGVAQPAIQEADLGAITGRIDVYQPIFVRYAATDAITGQGAADALKWLREHHGNITDERGGVRDGIPERMVNFFEHVVATRPWVQVRAFAADPDDPLAVRFRVYCSFKPEAYEWVFDADADATSLLPSPTYVFPQRGVYPIRVTVYPARGKPIQRTVNVTVPCLE